MLTRLIGENVQVELALASAPCLVRVDPAHVEQVVLNLAINARDAMPDGGTFRVETRLLDVDPSVAQPWGNVDAGPYVELVVSDSGHGMPPDVQSRVFEPFFTTKDVGKGTGLGLSTVYGIVAQNGGYIRVTSEVNRGTTFTVLIPRVEAEAPGQSSSPLAPRASRGSETILLVEDEPALGKLAATVLRRQGYWVLEATNGPDALVLSSRHAGPIHLLVTDVVMPDMAGASLAQRLIHARPRTRVLYMSGYTNDPETLGLGPDTDFIGKPFTPAELLDRVRGLLDRAQDPDRPDR
jgi:CheY-like chemotaxis protein